MGKWEPTTSELSRIGEVPSEAGYRDGSVAAPWMSQTMTNGRVLI